MNLSEQKKFFEEFTDLMANTLIKKGNDYSQTDADRLSNFKLAGAITGMSAQKQCLSLIATKVARLGALLDAKDASNESIDDSVLDLACYSVLLGMLNKDLI